MSEKELVSTELPDIADLEKELTRERVKLSNKSLIIGLLCALAAIILLVTVFVSFFPIYRVHGSSMEPTIGAGDTIVCIRGGSYDVGDVVAVEFDGKILIKRLAAKGGDWVEIDENGALYINGEVCKEPYAALSADESEAIPPLQVPKGEWYILGDNRTISGDSRLSEIGTVDDGKIIGKVLFRLFPLSRMGSIG